MNGCKINSRQDFVNSIIRICNSSRKLGVKQGSEYIRTQVSDMIQIAKSTSEPESQLQLLREALDVFYNAPGDIYGKFLSMMFPKGVSNLLFNPDYNETLAEDKAVSSTYEEAAKAGRIVRQKNFLDSKFKNAPNAKLYFKRSSLSDMVETFLVERSGDNPRYFTTQEEMNENVKAFKQKLLDRVFAYFENNPLIKSQVKTLPRTMYVNGNYTGVIEEIRSVIDSKLSPEMFLGSVKSLEDFYSDYRDGDRVLSTNAKLFLDAYNAWITLQNFDVVVKDTFGSIVKVNDADNKHTHDLHKYEIKGRATNMWNNWTTSDDITSMSEVISEVTQALINTSRMYRWGSSEAYPDRYVSFHDFNYVIGLIKKQALNTVNDTIIINDLEGISDVSLDTKHVLFSISAWNRANGVYESNDSGMTIPKAVTFKQLLSRMNENPQRYLHAIFDILCKTNLLENDQFSGLSIYDKNMIWSFYKEIFGGDGNPRSLYRLHTTTQQDSVYQIVTQVAASTFPEEYLQYYEKSDGTISSRLLKDYAVDSIKNTLFNSIQQTAVTLNSAQYSKYGISYTKRDGQDNYLGEAFIKIPIEPGLVFNIQATSNKVYIDQYTPEQMDKIWKNPQVQKLFKELLGVDFESDPDLKNAYMEVVHSSSYAIKNLGELVGRIVYSSIVNNEIIPQYHPKALEDSKALKAFITTQFGSSNTTNYFSKVDWDTGLIPVLPLNLKASALGSLAMAMAINSNLLASAQSKTGEGTSLANYALSRMRNFYPNQVEVQCKKRESAVKDLSFVVNSNGLFEGILSRRELKTLNTNQQSTKFSDVQSFQLSFINDFIAGFIPNQDPNSYIKDGHVSFLPTVNSDKSQIDGLLVNLHAKSSIKNGTGGFKKYLELTDREIEQEMKKEFKGMYKSIITNICNELEKVYNLLPEAIRRTYVIDETSVLTKHHSILFALNQAFASNTSLGATPKAKITNGLHTLITTYNNTHRRNPIMLSQQVHYIFDNDGELTTNKTLEALYGRFEDDLATVDKVYLNNLYSQEIDYQSVVANNNIGDLLGVEAFCKWNDFLTAEELFKMNFKVILRGSDAMVRHSQPEIQFLRGDMMLSEEQMNNPAYNQFKVLNAEMKNWVGSDGLMIIAKGLDANGNLVNITSKEQLYQVTNVRLHPMLSKLNRLDYLCTQQYTIATVGSHYVHKGDKKESSGFVLAEEAKRWLASNKRNVAATSTVHLFQNKQLDGAPSQYNVAIVDDIFYDLYNVMGDLYLEGHAPLDGGMFCNAFLSDLENNSLAGEKAGWDKKHFGTFYSELYGAGGIVKTAGFAPNNVRMRRSEAWQNLQRNMSDHKWLKEYADENGNDVLEVLDITKNYLGTSIDYTQALKGQPIMYKRPVPNSPEITAAYKQTGIISKGNNTYIIKEVEINSEGVEIGPEISREVVVDTNWALYTEVFGGFNSIELGSNGKIQWSENSIKLMTYAMNNVGYRKNTDALMHEARINSTSEDAALLKNHLDTVETGLDQDDVWQPLKYSDIHYTPNIGAIKSLQFNLNPDGEAVLESKVPLNFMTMRLAQLGIQLDKEHHADAADVSMPTQIIQAMANRSFTEYDKEAYEALAVLTRQSTQNFLKGVEDIITGGNSEVLVEEVTNLILDTLLHKSSEDNSVNAILKPLLEKAEQGKTVKFADDIKGKVAWSDPTISNKLFSALSSTLTNIAVKMKFAGSLSVICPTEKIEARYGDRSLDSFSGLYNEDGSTRTSNTKEALKAYQQSVINGSETDSEGRNLLVYDSSRDFTSTDVTDNTLALNTIHSLLLTTLGVEHSFNRLMNTDDDTLEQVVKDALNRNSLDSSVSAVQYVQRTVNTIKEANLTFVDVLGAINTLKAKHQLHLPDTIISTLETVRQLLADDAPENRTTTLSYGEYKQYENLINAVFDITGDRDYNAQTKGYDVTPGELQAIRRITAIFHQIQDPRYLSVLSGIVHSTSPLGFSPATEILEPIVSGEVVKDSSTKATLTKVKLSKAALLKTQHHYVVEFDDGSSEEVTINTPEDYYRVKNWICFGKKSEGAKSLIEPLDYDSVLAAIANNINLTFDEVAQTRLGAVYAALSSPVLLQESYKQELGVSATEARKMFGLFKSKAKGGLTIEQLAENIYHEHPELYEDDLEVRSLIIEALQSAHTMGDIHAYPRQVALEQATQAADVAYSNYAHDIWEKYQKTPEEYVEYYRTETTTAPQVTKVYENVMKGRSLSAYNVRFSDKYGYEFQIFDLDSINLLFKMNNLMTKPSDKIKGYKLFTELTPDNQQLVLSQVFRSSAFPKAEVYEILKQKYPALPQFDNNFIANYTGDLTEFVSDLFQISKPRVYKRMQSDLFKLSESYEGKDRTVFVNGRAIIPYNITPEAYELIMPQVYQTVFGLQAGDDVQAILQDKDFFVKRGLSRFSCKLAHTDYDYELKTFNGEHYYILDSTQGIPEHFKDNMQTIFTETRKGKTFRVDSDGKVIYELASENDRVCKFGNVQVIVTDNPLFYVQNLNYNTLKVSPERVTQESYDNLVETLSLSKRTNSKNFIKAITNPDNTRLSLKAFKEYNTELDNLTYETVKHVANKLTDFKSVAQICRILLKNGRELHTSFRKSLDLIAGRIPAQSQQSFMTQRVVGFDASGLNTAMVSTFQLFLQGSDLDIDAVTLLGYDFDNNGKFVAWSPYFNFDSIDMYNASAKLPLPTGLITDIQTSAEAPNNFFDVYDKYFGTLFKHIVLPSGKIKTINGVPELQMDITTPEGMTLLAAFLRDVKKYGINIQAPVTDGVIDTTDPNFFKQAVVTSPNGEVTDVPYTLFKRIEEFGLGIRPNQTYQIAQQLAKFVDTHNNYLNTAEEHLRDKMAKNYIVHYIYKVAESPCNQTEGMVSVDQSTKVLKDGAKAFAQASGETTHAPGRVLSKTKMVGEGQAGKSGVGIGAVGIKANSATQFYISELIDYGSEWDRSKILFKHQHVIDGKTYRGFANAYTGKTFSQEEIAKMESVFNFIDSLESPDQVTPDVAQEIAAMLSIAVDNAKDLALAKINSGPKLMGMYVYGMTLGIPTKTLISIMTSPEGMILKEMLEGSHFNNDSTSFRVLDVFKKLQGDLGGDLVRYECKAKTLKGHTTSYQSNVRIKDKNFVIKSNLDALFAAMYPAYKSWLITNNPTDYHGRPLQPATTFNGMLKHILPYKGLFNNLYRNSIGTLTMYSQFMQGLSTNESYANWEAALAQTTSYLHLMADRVVQFRSRRANDLRILAEGAEEMRVLGSILGINKGLKTSISDTETFIDTIENLIIDRKKAMGIDPKESDKIDFLQFMVDENYQKECIDAYEKVKHSVNILHLITKVPHFKGYLHTQTIPIAFFTAASVKYRTIHKYRNNVNAGVEGVKPESLFNMFGVDSRRDKESILKGLENLIQYKLLTRWLASEQLKFKIPAGFKYFTKKGEYASNESTELLISLHTPEGLATFKKYMEEICIPALRDNVTYSQNTFIKNLIRVSYDKTPVHSSVTTYSLPGDLMAKQGRQGELNAKMFADFQQLSTIAFQPEIGIPSLADAFYLYAQYCYMGRKGQKSLMSVFDLVGSRNSLSQHFNDFTALMDMEGSINCSKEELIVWCAPAGTQRSKSKYAYVTSSNTFGVSLQQRIEDQKYLTEDDFDRQDMAMEFLDDEDMAALAKNYDKFRVYKSEYKASQYDRLTRNHFLVPITTDAVSEVIDVPLKLEDRDMGIGIQMDADQVVDIQFSPELQTLLNEKITSGQLTKFTSIEDARQALIKGLPRIPYRINLLSETKQEIDYQILQTIIDQLINC